LYYGAIDLHSDNSVLGIMDDRGQRLCSRRLPNQLEVIRKAVDPFAAELKGIVVESTYNWYWLVDGLREAGYQVHLANTAATEPYSGLKHSDDETDAWWLAELLRLGLLKEGYVYPQQQRALRDLLRKRAHLVQQRSRNILSVQNLTNRNLGVRLSGREAKRLSVAGITETYDNEDLALALTSTLEIMGVLDKQIRIIEKRVKDKVKLSEPYQLLQTVSGIGEILAMAIMLEAGEIGRFPTVGDFASYCRCVKSQRLSNHKKKGTGNRKNGNAWLRWAFIEAANFAIRFNPVIQRYYRRKAGRTNAVVARSAVAHKLARASYYVLRDRVAFDVYKCFGQQRCGRDSEPVKATGSKPGF
jgi:transposase